MCEPFSPILAGVYMKLNQFGGRVSLDMRKDADVQTLYVEIFVFCQDYRISPHF